MHYIDCSIHICIVRDNVEDTGYLASLVVACIVVLLAHRVDSSYSYSQFTMLS
jgi:hypothetical protein